MSPRASPHLWRVLRKETTLALTIGLVNGLVMAGIAYVWKGQALLAGIIALGRLRLLLLPWASLPCLSASFSSRLRRGKFYPRIV
jgi:Mg/Co/Ni transporter MgtE